MKTYLVFWYDGNENHVDWMKSEYPDSCAPHVWSIDGLPLDKLLPEDVDPQLIMINAVVEVAHKSDIKSVWMDEQQVMLDGDKVDGD